MISKQTHSRVARILQNGLCAAFVLAPLSPLPAQQIVDALAVEAVAIQTVLAQEGIPKGRVAISSEFDVPRTAPGRRLVDNFRPAARTESLAQQLNLYIARLPEVAGHCASTTGMCPLSGVEVIVSLSEPEFIGDTAKISATAHYNTGGARQPTAYQTIAYVLLRRAGTWHVISSEHLGVS
jgi:hypothetical protein